MLMGELGEGLGFDNGEGGGGGGDDGGGAGAVGVEEGHFADMVAGGAGGDLDAADVDGENAFEDEVNFVVEAAFLDDGFAFADVFEGGEFKEGAGQREIPPDHKLALEGGKFLGVGHGDRGLGVRESAASGDLERLMAGKPDEKGSATADTGFEPDGAAVGFDDGFDDSGAEAGAAALAVGDKGFEKFVADLLGDAHAVVADDDFGAVALAAAEDGDVAAAVFEGVDSVGDEVLEDAQEFGFDAFDGDVLGLHLDIDVFLLEVGEVEVAEALEEFLEVDGGEFEVLLAAGVVGDFIGHVDHTADLLLHVAADLLGAVVFMQLHDDLGSEADQGEGVFEVVDDGVHHSPDDCHLLGFEHVLDVMAGGMVEVADDALEDEVDRAGRFADKIDEGFAGDAGNFDASVGDGGKGAGLAGEDADFAEELALVGAADDLFFAVGEGFDERNLAFEGEKNGVGRTAFLENTFLGLILRDLSRPDEGRTQGLLKAGEKGVGRQLHESEIDLTVWPSMAYSSWQKAGPEKIKK